MKKFVAMLVVALTFIASQPVLASVTPPPEPSPLPTTAEECKKYGWEAYEVFKNQGDCVSYVVTNGLNQPALLP